MELPLPVKILIRRSILQKILSYASIYVKIYTGAVVLDPITVGNNSIIGANATIVKNVPENTTIVPAAGRIIKENGNKVNKPF